MSSQWDNKYAIMRDLSLVQGCVPVDVAGTVEAGDKPPSQNVSEDTEEDFYRTWVGGGDFAEPDLGLIKQMLDVVRNHDVPLKEEIEIEKIIQISKMNPTCTEFYPHLLAATDKELKPLSTQKPQCIQKPQSILKKTTDVSKTRTEIVKTKVKKTRNVAVQSLLENINRNAIENKNNANIANIEPSHTNNVNNKAVEKVSGWLKTQKLQPSIQKEKNKNALQLVLDPSSMFKKKKPHDFTAPKPVEEVKKTSPSNCGKYVPSNNAAKYYKKFLECSRMKEMVQENVWTKVERQMKEIDERRAAEAELFALSLALCRDEAPGILNDPVKQKLDMVFLPRHRHALPSPCRVCELHNTLTTSPSPTDDDLWTNKMLATPVEINETKNVGDAWRYQHKTFIAEHVKKVDDFCKKSKVDYNDNTTYEDRCDSHEVPEKQSVSGFDIENGNVNTIENWRSHDKVMENVDDWRNETSVIVDANIQSWRSKPKDKENDIKDKDSDNACTDSVYTENAESWASLDDDDEIDAWKFEILDDEDNEHYNDFHETPETIDGPFRNVYESPLCSNENEIVEIDSYVDPIKNCQKKLTL